MNQVNQVNQMNRADRIRAGSPLTGIFGAIDLLTDRGRTTGNPGTDIFGVDRAETGNPGKDILLKSNPGADKGRTANSRVTGGYLIFELREMSVFVCRAAFMLVLMISLGVSAKAQSGGTASFTASGDYAAYPEIRADYSHLQLELEVEESGRLNGEASYTFQLLRSGVDTLVLDAVGLSINSVVLSGQTLDYTIENGQLAITLPDSLPIDTAYLLRIVYSASSGFGVHTDEWQMRWGSVLPGALHHWLPVRDHPRNRFTTDVTFSFPAGYTAAFSGSPSLSGVVSVNQQSMRFVSDWELPAPSLTFAVGIADRAELTSGRNRVHMMSRSELLTEERMNELLVIAGNALQQAASITGSPYPYRDLQIVVLDDSRWEVKNYGAGIIYAYMNEGNPEGQILKGIAAQWAGIQRMEEQWTDAGAVILLREWLVNRLSGVDRPLFAEDSTMELSGGDSGPGNPYSFFTLTDSLAARADSLHDLLAFESELQISAGLYSEFSDAGRNGWIRWAGSETAAPFREAMLRAVPDGLFANPGILNWQSFAEVVYAETGFPMFNAPDPAQIPLSGMGSQESESYLYRVEYTPNEADGTLRLLFEAEGVFTDELVPVTVWEYGPQGPVERSLSFTGATDEVVLSVSSAINSIDLSIADDAAVDVRLVQQKPFMYWIYQLRNSEVADERVEAAAGLRDYRENPDLQLALLDFLDLEEDLRVRAEMIRTLAAVTNGASGTAQLFLRRYDPSAPLEHRLAIIEAYGNYPGNEQVITSLRQIIVNSNSPEIRLPAIAVMASVTDAQRFRAFTEAMIPLTEMTPQVPLLLIYQAAKGEVESAVQVAGALLQPGYPFELRAGGLSMLLAFDHSMEGWGERLPGLLSDLDPRIRYLAVEGLQNLTAADRNELISERLETEQDLRVIRRLTSY